MRKTAATSGELHLTVVEGRNLRRPWSVFGRLSPVCIVHVGRQQRTTEVHEGGGSSPFWNALFTFDVDEHSTDVDIQVMTPSVCKLACLGSVTLPIELSRWQDREFKDLWLPVTIGKQPCTTSLKYGELRVRIEFKLATTLYKHPSVIALPVRRHNKDKVGRSI
ncbi:hypothetical protein, variant 4 [Aphanomyces astaci]|uniref:C2 domain-containing protein n=1 Tax=Aphanomyces astaci TaxID=112090 RepID=W4FNK9_APHAT|nr:hypothetical protein, variant 3 [Aphanomyces astaci]XP_009842216.1 hypothetical protein, variant 4 [Aphanomyces astaci]ETV68272.1 hypothetical protein, variant 3 [Aphanomyces astaci]ETV68273.1 hypothetical protein, variant 4 [Aphanomyces astaci]|eukprot:XP_009842214.1 hypothetical protein, variant 3 [Aphanomyces astaci]